MEGAKAWAERLGVRNAKNGRKRCTELAAEFCPLGVVVGGEEGLGAEDGFAEELELKRERGTQKS